MSSSRAHINQKEMVLRATEKRGESLFFAQAARGSELNLPQIDFWSVNERRSCKICEEGKVEYIFPTRERSRFFVQVAPERDRGQVEFV